MNSEDILSSLSTAVLVLDDSLSVRFVNAAASQLLNLGVSKLKGAYFSDAFLALDISLMRLQHVVKRGQNLSVSSTTLTTLDEIEHTIDLMVSPLNSGLSVFELRVIDQQKRIEQQINQDAQQQAARYLVRNLAHEIKNPLGGLRGAAQLLSKQSEGSEYQEFTNMIIEQADRMKGLVDRLLGPQRPTPHHAHNIHQVIEKVIQLIDITLPENIIVMRDYDPSLPEIPMDPEQIQQALLNLIQNSIQALTADGGTITVKDSYSASNHDRKPQVSHRDRPSGY